MTAPRANIYAVAERAGVSIATVSRVQRGVGPVSTETRERVELAIAELGYTPSPTGRALAGQRLDAMGIVFPDLAGPYYSAVLLGAEEASVAAGSSLLILATHGRPQAAELVRELSSRVDGLVIMGRTIDDDHGARSSRRACRSSCSRVGPWTGSRRCAVRAAIRPGGSLSTSSPSTGTVISPSSATPAHRRTPKTAGRGSRTLTAPWMCRRRPPPSRPRSTSTGVARGQDGHSTAATPHRARVRLRRGRARRLPRTHRTGPAPRAGHRSHRVRRHPARALRHTRLDHRSPADGPARPHRRGTVVPTRRRASPQRH